MSAEMRELKNRDALAAVIYEAISMHWWESGKCSCGWKKKAGEGHKHHLANLAVDAIREMSENTEPLSRRSA